MGKCRACLSDLATNPESLFKNGLNEVFKTLTTLTISDTDGLPQWLCYVCFDKITCFNSFKSKCIENDKILKQALAATINDHNFVYIKEELDYSNSSSSSSPYYDPNNQDDIYVEKEQPVQCEQQLLSKSRKNLQTPVESEIFVTNKNTSKPHLQQNVCQFKLRLNYEYPYTCPICKRGFRVQERFDGHLREHDGKRAAVCEYCNHEYANWSGLYKHIKQSHKNEMKFTCKCGKHFMNPDSLANHSCRLVKQKNFLCEHCSSVFYDKTLLNKHKLSHTTETPFHCDECDKKFKSKKHLKAHKFRHTGIRNFKCEFCSKAFVSGPDLRQHIVSHTGEKRFHCKLCGEGFKYRSELAVHTRNHGFVS